jgi:hypothetical protein
MNARSHKLRDKIVDDIVYPTFYHEKAELIGVEVDMG